MKIIKPLLLATLAAVSMSLAAPVMAQTQPVDRIAAVVNEDVILQSELDRAIANVRAQYAANAGQLPPDHVLAKQVLERLVLNRLQVSRAQQSGLEVTDAEVDQAIAGIAQQNHLNQQQLVAKLAQEGIGFSDFRSSIRDEIVLQRLRQSFAQSRIHVSEAEVNAVLSQQGTAAGGRQYHLAHLLVALPEGATAEQIATGEKKISGVKGLIDRGEMDFKAAAVRYSDSPNALEGGDLGWRSESEIPPAFAQTIKTMQPGQMIGPIRGPSGFQLLKLVEVREASATAAHGAATDEQRAEIRQHIGQRKLEEEYNRFLQEMRGDAYVDVRSPSVIDPSAPSTTAPAQTGG